MTVPGVSCKALATQKSSEWPCSMCPIPPGSGLWGWGHPTYIVLIFPGCLEFWTPLQIPSWGPPLGCTLLQKVNFKRGSIVPFWSSQNPLKVALYAVFELPTVGFYGASSPQEEESAGTVSRYGDPNIQYFTCIICLLLLTLQEVVGQGMCGVLVTVNIFKMKGSGTGVRYAFMRLPARAHIWLV